MRSLRGVPTSSPLGVATPRDVAGKDHGHGVVGLPPVLSARLAGASRVQTWPWVNRRQKASVVAGNLFPKRARA